MQDTTTRPDGTPERAAPDSTVTGARPKVARVARQGRSTPSRSRRSVDATAARYGEREVSLTAGRGDAATLAQDAEYEALLSFITLAPIGLAETRLDGTIQRINPIAMRLLAPLARGRAILNLFATLEPLMPDLRQRAEGFRGARGKICEDFQMQVALGVQGQHDATVLSLSLIKLDRFRLMAVISDVSESVQRERDLRESQAWVNTMVTGISDYATVLLDAEGVIVHGNPGIERVTGFLPHEVVGHSYDVFYPTDAVTAHSSNTRLEDADLHGWTLDEGWRRRADGTRFWGSCLIAPLANTDSACPETHGYSLIVRDISDRREVNEALRRSVSYDHLTGLANRRAFLDAAEAELERWSRTKSPLALMVIDADHFKVVNDTYGHAAGDAVLRHLATSIASASRTLDVVARFGGEEFVVLLPGTPLEGAETVGRRLLKAVSTKAVDVDGTRIRYTVSAGVALMEEGMDGIAALMKRADAALYVAKANGRNRVERWSESTPLPGTPHLLG